MNRFSSDLFGTATKHNSYQSRSYSIPQINSNNNLREVETEFTRGLNCNQNFQNPQGHTKDFEVELGDDTHEINPTHLLEILRYRFSTIAANIVEDDNFMSKDSSQIFRKDIQSLSYDFQKTQQLLLDEFHRQSKMIRFCYEQFTDAQNQLFRISAERDRLAKEVNNIQKLLVETRDMLSISEQKYRNLDNKWKTQMESRQTLIKENGTYLGLRYQHRDSHCMTISTPHSAKSPNIGNLTSFDGNLCNDTVTATSHKHQKPILPIRRSVDSNVIFPINSQTPKEQYIFSNNDLTYSETKLCNVNSVTNLEKLQVHGLPGSGQNYTQLESEERNSKEFYPLLDIDLDQIRRMKPHPNSSLCNLTPKNDTAAEFKVLFDKLLNLVEEWCKNNTGQFSKRNDINLAAQNSTLWSYMIRCVDASDSEASESKVKEFISQSSTRYRFIIRIVVTYIFKDILSLKNFYGFIDAATEKLVEFESRMEKRGMTTVARQSLINQRDAAVRIIINHEDSVQWRSVRLNQHIKRLQDMLCSLLNEDCDHSFADHDLRIIIVTALDLCARVHSSALTFQIIFPDIRSKFNTQTMIVCDQDLVKSQALHLTPTRLRLIITPIVTMRDDRGTTIKAKNIQLAKVLTIP